LNILHIGGGYFELSNGEKVKGKRSLKAEGALKETAGDPQIMKMNKVD
jgi:hypothetical protein